jgi:leader peptidase (prepilin peptidase)/N-methyltransferase
MFFSSLPEPVWRVFAIVLGLLVGSFANVCIHRLPLEESIVHPRSRCPRCRTMIGALDNLPILSYLLLLGRCRVCRAPIGARYPLIEAANGALYGGVAVMFGPTIQAAVLMAFVTALLVLAFIDLDYQILPNVITLPGIAAGLAYSLLEGPPSPLVSAMAAAGGYLSFMLVARTWEVLRGIEALGQGDWKLAAMLGAFLGGHQLMATVFLATLAGSIVGIAAIAFQGRGMQHRLPLGTFLCVAAIVVLFVGDPLVAWYRRLLLLEV